MTDKENPPLEEHPAFLALPDGRIVPWLEATEADHLAHAAWHRKLVAGLTREPELHKAAAREGRRERKDTP